MTTATLPVALPTPTPPVETRVTPRRSALASLTSRRLRLSAHTPREIVVPLLTPIMFALVIAPALAKMIPSSPGGVDYKTFVAVGTVGLLVPLSCMFAGIGVIVDRDSGARRELLAAPIPRPLLVLANLAVAVLICTLQLGALFIAAVARGDDFNTRGTGVVWFVLTAAVFAVFSYGVAEVLANRMPKQEEYVGATPAVAILPWFLAGALFPISALPAVLGGITKVLPLTHALAVMRYGLLDPHGRGLHDIWGMTNPTTEAALSLLVVAAWATFITAASIRVFRKASVT